jgi:ABC-type phosphate transport system substrate-binding protein
MMGLNAARRAVAACAVSAAAMAVLGAPGVASAATQCSGSNIVAAGSTLQKLAQVSVWSGDFHTSKNKKACSGEKKPEIKYESIGSGEGLEDWGVLGVHPFELNRVAIVTTDEPINEEDKKEIEAHETTPTEKTVQSIPVIQAAVAIIMHLPKGCTAKSEGAKERLVLDNVTLEGIYSGSVKDWGQIKDDGDQLVGCEVAPELSPIIPIVRLDASGTTHIFKKYLSLINQTGKFETEKNESKTWNEIDEGTENTVWPKAAKVRKAAKEGGGALVTEVASVEGSIGYANLADARSNGGFSKVGVGGGGPGTSKFWAPIQNSGLSTTKKLSYADPSTDGDTEPLADANCAKEKYTNGKGKTFPPSSTDEAWNQVTTETKQKNYPICGFSYDMTMSHYGAYTSGGDGSVLEGEAITASNYLEFVLEDKAEGGQLLIENHDYEALPKKVLKEAQAGAKITAF